MTFNALGELSDKEFLTMSRQCSRELETARGELMELTAQRDSAKDFKEHIDTIRRVLREAERDAAGGIINKEFVDKYIDRIFATMEDDGSMRLQIKIFTGETTEKYLQNLRSRTGHTFYKMLPYAEAMGQGRRFVALFHDVQLEPCQWYEAARGTPTTASAFYDHYLDTLDMLNISIQK